MSLSLLRGDGGVCFPFLVPSSGDKLSELKSEAGVCIVARGIAVIRLFGGDTVQRTRIRQIKVIRKRLLAVDDEAAELDSLDGEKCSTKNDAPNHDDDDDRSCLLSKQTLQSIQKWDTRFICIFMGFCIASLKKLSFSWDRDAIRRCDHPKAQGSTRKPRGYCQQNPVIYAPHRIL